MWELIWFLLGVFTYKTLVLLFGVTEKIKFIESIRFFAFILIGRAFEELLKVHVLKYSLLKNDPAIASNQIKLLKNEDELFLAEWQKKAVHRLNASVPPLYKNCIDLKDWDDLMSVLKNSHDETIQSIGKIHD